MWFICDLAELPAEVAIGIAGNAGIRIIAHQPQLFMGIVASKVMQINSDAGRYRHVRRASMSTDDAEASAESLLLKI